MNSYTLKGNAIYCVIKAESKAEAAKILFSPIVEVGKALAGVSFEKK